jgi:hypothetical protein
MIKLIQEIWKRVTNFLFPKQYFAWQTTIYLGIFSLVMSWIAHFSTATQFTEWLIATGSWIFFAVGVGWFLEDRDVRPFGIPIAPWVTGAIVCTYGYSYIPGRMPLALTVWPLVSVLIMALPFFLSWDLRLRQPPPPARQQLVLLVLVALLMSSWFQFYFRLQSWLREYPTLLADDFGRSEFVTRVSRQPQEGAEGVPLLVSAEVQILDALDNMPWPWVERWLLNRDERMTEISRNALNALQAKAERTLWRMEAHPSRRENGYDLRLVAIWSGPTSEPEGYYLEKTCTIRPQTLTPPRRTEDTAAPSPTVTAKVICDLDIPRKPGLPQGG